MADILVTGKKISDMDLATEINGDEKIPTGSAGDVAITPDQLVEYTRRNTNTSWGKIVGDIDDQLDLKNKFLQASSSLSSHVNNKENPHEVTKAQVGLGNVDNTSDLNKPVSSATQSALDTKADKSYVDGELALKVDQVNFDDFYQHEKSGEIYQFDAAFATAIGGYPLHARIMLSNGDIVQNTITNNENNPNSNMTGWSLTKDSQIKTWSGRSQESKNKDLYVMQDFPDLQSGISSVNKLDVNSPFNTDTTLPSQTEINMGFGRTVFNNSMGRSLKNAVLRFIGNLTRLSQTRLSSGSPSSFAIRQKSLDATPVYYNTVDSVNVHDGSSGIEVAGAELYAHNFRVTNPTTNRGAYGIYQKDMGDTTVSNVYIENCEIGIESWKSWVSYDTHVVYAKTAFNFQATGNFGSSAKMFGVFNDTPKETGMVINRSRGTFYGVDIWNLGKYTDYSTQIGLNFGQYGYNTAFFGLYINNGDDAYTDNVTTYMQFNANAVNNLFIHVQGKYKLRAQDITSLRNQTVVGCTDEWARHNNIVRKCRGNVFGVANGGGTATLTVKLDYNYDFATLSNTLLLIKGTWVSRTTDNQGAYGTIEIPFGYGVTTGLPAVVTRTGGSNTVIWSVASKTLVGDTLTLNLVHNSTNGASGTFNGTFAVELERGLDSGLYSV